jgi:hypothetical protein
MSVWALPGTHASNKICEGASVEEGVTTAKECLDHCAVTLGGPPTCGFAKFDEGTRMCEWGADCENVLTNPPDPQVVAQELGTNEFGILELYCGFSQSVYDTCVWAQKQEDLTDTATLYDGWRELQEFLVGLTQGVYNNTQGNTGHSECHRKCKGTEGCGYYMYSTTLMQCFLLGDFEDASQIKVGCSYVFTASVGGGGPGAAIEPGAASKDTSFVQEVLASFEDDAASATSTGGTDLSAAPVPTVAPTKSAPAPSTAPTAAAVPTKVPTAAPAPTKVPTKQVVSEGLTAADVFGAKDEVVETLTPDSSQSLQEHLENLEKTLAEVEAKETEEPAAGDWPQLRRRLQAGEFQASHALAEEGAQAAEEERDDNDEKDAAALLAAAAKAAKVNAAESLPPAVRDVLASFTIFMLQDAPFTLYDHCHGDNVCVNEENCECLDGFVPDVTNTSRCNHATSAELVAGAAGAAGTGQDVEGGDGVGGVVAGVAGGQGAAVACTEVEVEGPVNADAINTHPDLASAITAEYEDCVIFWDCDSNGLEDTNEPRCVVEDGYCHVEKARNDFFACNAVLDVILQTGHACDAAIGLTGSISVRVQLNTSDLSPCPVEKVTAALETAITEKAPKKDTIASTDPEYRCDLCYQHSCTEIEETGFTMDILNNHQLRTIAFHADTNGSTLGDTIGACVFCEGGDSGNPDQCVFKNPRKKAQHWPKCDPLCLYESCQNIDVMIGEHFITLLTAGYISSFDNISTYVDRFVSTLCSDCPSSAKCRSFTPEELYADFDDDGAREGFVTFGGGEEERIPCVDSGVPPQMAIADCEAVFEGELCNTTQGQRYCAKTCGACTTKAEAASGDGGASADFNTVEQFADAKDDFADATSIYAVDGAPTEVDFAAQMASLREELDTAEELDGGAVKATAAAGGGGGGGAGGGGAGGGGGAQISNVDGVLDNRSGPTTFDDVLSDLRTNENVAVEAEAATKEANGNEWTHKQVVTVVVLAGVMTLTVLVGVVVAHRADAAMARAAMARPRPSLLSGPVTPWAVDRSVSPTLHHWSVPQVAGSRSKGRLLPQLIREPGAGAGADILSSNLALVPMDGTAAL